MNFTLDILHKETHIQDYKDTYLENQARQIVRLQTDGKFITADELCWLLASSTWICWEKLYHFHTYEHEVPMRSFLTGLGFTEAI